MQSPYQEHYTEWCLVAKHTDDASNAHSIGDERDGSSTAIIILAAGASIRMGRPKLLLTYGHHKLFRHAAETAAASICPPMLVVLGAYADPIQCVIDHDPVRFYISEWWAAGIEC